MSKRFPNIFQCHRRIDRYCGPANHRAFYGLRCQNRHDLTIRRDNKGSETFTSLIGNKRNWIKKKFKFISDGMQPLQGQIDVSDSQAKDIIQKYSGMDPNHLNDNGNRLHIAILDLKHYVENCNSSKPQAVDDFLSNFNKFYSIHYKTFKDTLLHDLLANAVKRISNNHQGNRLGQRVMDFYCALNSISPKAADMVSANTFGPLMRNLRKHERSLLSDSNTFASALPIINITEEECIRKLYNYIATHLSKQKEKLTPIVWSISIDATKVPEVVQST